MTKVGHCTQISEIGRFYQVSYNNLYISFLFSEVKNSLLEGNSPAKPGVALLSVRAVQPGNIIKRPFKLD